MPPKPTDVDKIKGACGSLRRAVELVAQCTRSLILAHFDTAESDTFSQGKRGFYGAAHSLLASRREDEGISDEQWLLYKEIWETLTKGIQLRETGDVVQIDAKRSRRGSYSNGWPGIFAIVDALLGDFVPRGLLTDWYRADLCRRYEIDDSQEFIVFSHEWLERFNQINSATTKRNELLYLIEVPDLTRRLWAEGLIEALDFLALLQFAGRDLSSYKIRFKADPQFVLTNLFGRSTGIEGLDYLLYGGLSVPKEEKLNIVITGAPGMGKSTLGLAMGAQVAARGGLCLFFRFEQTEGATLRQVAHYHRKLLPFFEIWPINDNELDIRERHEQSKDQSPEGLMILSDIAADSTDSIQSTALRIANSPKAMEYPERIVVFDSISAAQGYGKEPDAWRKFLLECTSMLRAMGYVVVLLVEREPRDSANFENYVADLDIRLGYQRIEDYPFRALEITKSRWQPSHRGQHVYSIMSGMKIYPSSAAVMAARRLREARVRYAENRLIDPGVRNFALYLGGVKQWETDAKKLVPWWNEGSVTALIGTRGSLKSSFAHAFSTTIDQDSSVTPCSLSLHFADEYQSCLGDLRRENQRSFEFGVRYDIPLSQKGRDGLCSTLSYILFRSGHLAAGQVLHTVRDIIGQKRKKQTPIRRAIISDAGNIAPDFPALKAEQAFLPALCDLLTSEGITTIIVYSRPEGGSHDYVVDQVRSVAENIIKFEQISFAGREYSSISVERSADFSHDHGVYEIRESQHRRFQADIEVAPTFDLVVDLKAGAPKVAKVKIMLDAGTKLQTKYHSTIKKFYQGIGAYDVRVLDHSTAFAKQGGVQHVTAVERALWLIQVDANELPLNSTSTASGLCDLSLFHVDPERLMEELVYPPLSRHKRSKRKGLSEAPIFSIPYYLNPSFLVVKKQFQDFALAHNRWRNVGVGLGNYSWEDLITAASEFRESNSDFQDHVIFDFPISPSETLNCLFLEVLASLSNSPLNERGFSSSFGPQSPYMKDLIQTMLTLRRLADETLKNHEAPGVRNRSNDGDADGASSKTLRFGTKKALIWRHWYSSFREMAADMGAGKGQLNPGLTLLQLPGQVWTNGDWHLAILDGSVGVRQGIEIILGKFVNKPNSLLLMTKGVGLPPFRDFYDDESELLVTGVPSKWFSPYIGGERVIHRSLLRHYKSIAPLLSYYLASIVRDSAASKMDLTNKIKEKFLCMHSIIERSLPSDL